MPMPVRDPARFVDAVLADPLHKLPLPDRGGRLFSADGELIDQHHPFYAALLADGSLMLKPVVVEAQADDAAGKPPAVSPTVTAVEAPVPVAARPAAQKL